MQSKDNQHRLVAGTGEPVMDPGAGHIRVAALATQSGRDFHSTTVSPKAVHVQVHPSSNETGPAQIGNTRIAEHLFRRTDAEPDALVR